MKKYNNIIDDEDVYLYMIGNIMCLRDSHRTSLACYVRSFRKLD